MNLSHSIHTRRAFLRTGVLGGALSWTLPTFLSRTFDSLHAAAQAGTLDRQSEAPILVVLQMAGGNDGLNTLVPHGNDHYLRARPRLALKTSQTLKLNDQLGLHPALAGLKRLHDEGLLASIQGVGYPNPNRSHFRSTEIWQTASDSHRTERHGWIGRYFDHACAGADPTVGIALARQTPQAFSAARPLGISLQNPQNYRFPTGDDPDPGEMSGSEPFYRLMNTPDDPASGGSIGSLSGASAPSMSPLDYIERTALDAQLSSDKILEISRKGGTSEGRGYPASALASSLRLVSQLIAGGLPTRVFYVAQGGYDTHTNQAPTQQRLLQELGDSLAAFVSDLKSKQLLDRVLVMTFSEFGRRLSENASGGTDHGAASHMFLVGSRLRPGLSGAYPDLAPDSLLNGDPRFTTDFRSVYASVLQQWLQADPRPVLGQPFPQLPILA